VVVLPWWLVLPHAGKEDDVPVIKDQDYRKQATTVAALNLDRVGPAV
jgi:hypothetical protein